MRIVKLPNEEIKCYTVDEAPIFPDVSFLCKKRGNNVAKRYISYPLAFDIETTTYMEGDKHKAFMYHWQLASPTIRVYGRTWGEFISLMKKLKEDLKLNSEKRIVIAIHNAGFEHQFMINFMRREFGEPTIFAVAPRKPLKVTYDCGFEFRCSWKLTNMSLEKAIENEKGCKYAKMVGDLDYKKFRTPFTPINDTEFRYCIMDVVSLCDLVQQRMINERDNLESIPLTSTGYVRRTCRKATEHQDGYRAFFKTLNLSKEIYDMLKESARGGDTHANRLIAGHIMENVDPFDVQSSYPYVLMMKYFPCTKFTPERSDISKKDLDMLLSKKCVIMTIFLKGDVRVKNNVPFPYISSSKCRFIDKGAYDNGRVLYAEGLEITITELDYEIITRQYTFNELYIVNIYSAERGRIPSSIRKVIIDLFTEKSTLKWQIEREREHKTGAEILEDLIYRYNKCKNRINSVFGMMYTDPVREEINFLYGEEREENGGNPWKEESADITKSLEHYNKSRNSFLYYAWGIYTTAHARSHLQRLVNCATNIEAEIPAIALYCDTDSLYGVNLNLTAIEIENEKIRKEVEKEGYFAEIEGERFYPGVYEHDGHIDRFITLGAKKYAYEKGGKLYVTVSGVSKGDKSKGRPGGADELEKLENFKPGFIFQKAGGIDLYYDDTEEIFTLDFGDGEFESSSSVSIVDGEYTLNITGEYSDLIGMERFLKERKKMKKPENKNNATDNREQEGFSISNAKCWEDGRVTFNLHYGRTTIYGCRVIEGEKGDFISFPRHKGKDEKYYNYAKIEMTADEQAAVLKLVEDTICQGS